MWFLSFSICICILFASLFLAILLRFRPNNSDKSITPFRVLAVGVFISVLTTLMPLFVISEELGNKNAFSIFLISLHNTFQVFTINSDLNSFIEESNCPSYYATMLSVEFVVAPLFTLGFFISLLRDFSSNIRLLFSFFRDLYVFSELNERSIALGSDIKMNHKSAVIVYLRINERASKEYDDITESANRIHAICFENGISLKRFIKLGKQIDFFAINDEEIENVNLSLEFSELFKDREHTRLFVFAEGIESNLVFDNLDSGKVIVRRVNEVYSLINNILYNNGHEIFAGAYEDKNNKEKKISVLIIGLGQHGKEMLKALAWYCQMDGYSIEIEAFDIDVLAQSKFEAEAPELLSSDYNNNTIVSGEAMYNIHIHSGIDVFSKEFVDIIKAKKNTTIAFISLGSDERNIQIAANLRMYFERMRIHPSIWAIVYNSNIKSVVKDAKNFADQEYDIKYLGDVKSCYTEKVIINSALEDECIKSYEGRSDKVEAIMKFWKYEYNYRSKTASIIHVKARKECNIPGTSKQEDELSNDEKKIINDIEHRRWNAYTRAAGYIYSGSPDKSTRNDLGKMHNDLVSSSQLDEDEIIKDLRL